MTLLRSLALLALVVLVAAPAGFAAQSRTAGAASQATSTERAVISAINEVRAEHGLRPLRFAAGLWRAARGHSRDMGANDYFSHSSLDSGESFDERVLQFQNRRQVRWLGETIGWGSGALAEPREMVRMWMESPPHRRTLLDPRFRLVGVGIWAGTFQGHDGARVFTADFGG